MTLYNWIENFTMKFTVDGMVYEIVDFHVDSEINPYIGGPTCVYEGAFKGKVGFLGFSYDTFKDVEMEFQGGEAEDLLESFIEKCAEVATGRKGPSGTTLEK